MTASRRKRTATATVMSAVAVTALVGGTLAQFTDSDTTTAQTLKAGTVEIDLVEGAGWNTNLTNLAVGDTADRTVLVDNTSSLDVGAMRLSADLTDQVGEFGGKLSEAVTVDIIQDGSTLLANDVRLADLADGYNFTFPGANLPAHTDVTLGFHYEVVGAPVAQTGDRTAGARELTSNPDNKYQGSALTVAYTIDAIQRGGVDDRDATAPTDVTATVSGTSATVAFNAPATNPEGTVYTATAVEDAQVANASTGDTILLSSTTQPEGTVSASADPLTPVGVRASGLFSPITVTGLAYSTTYTFAVTASGPNGATTEPVYSNPVTTQAPPVVSGSVVAWGTTSNAYGQTTVPETLGNQVVRVVAGDYHAFAIKTDGTLVGWGSNTYKETVVPATVQTVKQVALGQNFTVALLPDNTVTVWGRNDQRQTDEPANLTGVVHVAAGYAHALAAKSDGTVVTWGRNNEGQATIPAGLTNAVKVAAGNYHSLALRADGTVVGWGRNLEKQVTIPAGLTGVIDIAARGNHSLALKADGTVVAWGLNNSGQATVPAGLTGVRHIAAGNNHSLALKEDGSLVVWGTQSAPTDPSARYLDATGGSAFTVAIKRP